MKTFYININRSTSPRIHKALNLPPQHATAKEFISEFGQDEWGNGYKFAFIRNPWDRVLAIYNYRYFKNRDLEVSPNVVPFSKWLELVFKENDPEYYTNAKTFMPQTDWLTDHENNIDMNFIARFENRAEDFNVLCKNLGVNADPLPLKTPLQPDYQSFYDDDSAEIINDWFSVDIANFNYSFD